MKKTWILYGKSERALLKTGTRRNSGAAGSKNGTGRIRKCGGEGNLENHRWKTRWRASMI